MSGVLDWILDLITLHDSKEKADEFYALAEAKNREGMADFLDANYPVKGGWGGTTPKQTPERPRDWFIFPQNRLGDHPRYRS
jgi:hypothetical protein